MGYEHQYKKVVSFMNMKGGVGKTTMCVNIAYCLTEKYKKKVLIIDMDPQANATQYLLEVEQYQKVINLNKTIYALYSELLDGRMYNTVIGNKKNNIDKSFENIMYKMNTNFHLIPGDLRMIKAQDSTNGLINRVLENYTIKNQLSTLYDYIFIDCPPTQSIFTNSALSISGKYIMPVKPDFLSSIGIDLFEQYIKAYNSTSLNKVKCLGIIFSLVKNYNYYNDKMEELKQNNFFTIFENYLNDSTKIAEGSEKHKLIYDIPNSKNAIIQITDELIEKEGKNK